MVILIIISLPLRDVVDQNFESVQPSIPYSFGRIVLDLAPHLLLTLHRQLII